MAAFIITFSQIPLLRRRGLLSCRSAPALPQLPGTDQAGLGGSSQLPFTSASISIPRVPWSMQVKVCLLLQHDYTEWDSCSSSSAAPVAGRIHNCRVYKEAPLHFSHHFQWLWLRANCWQLFITTHPEVPNCSLNPMKMQGSQNPLNGEGQPLNKALQRQINTGKS